MKRFEVDSDIKNDKDNYASRMHDMCEFLAPYRKHIAHILDVDYINKKYFYAGGKFVGSKSNIKKAEYVAKYEELLAVVKMVLAGEFQLTREEKEEENQKNQIFAQISEQLKRLYKYQRYIVNNVDIYNDRRFDEAQRIIRIIEVRRERRLIKSDFKAGISLDECLQRLNDVKEMVKTFVEEYKEELRDLLPSHSTASNFTTIAPVSHSTAFNSNKHANSMNSEHGHLLSVLLESKAKEAIYHIRIKRGAYSRLINCYYSFDSS